ncbi:MAG: hypothetical protein H0X24_04790 [Ktedonobacterales bacterium]|nr:hypothetical protein [Ktedonobacterales bacterium]
MQDYYTAAEAIKRLEIPRSTFYYLVEQGQIPKIMLPLRKQAVYPKNRIDILATDRGERATAPTEERMAFVIPTYEDLEQLIQIEKSVWGEMGIISPHDILARNPYNPESIHMLKDTGTDRVVSSITMSPLADGFIDKLIHFQLDESDIKPEDYRPFSIDKPLDCYVVSIIACHDLYTAQYAAALLRRTAKYLMVLAERGVTIRHIYTVANTDDGERLSRKLGFKEIATGKGPLGDNRKSFVLDLEEKKPSTELVKEYQGVIRNRNRRAKRQQKQTTPQNEAARTLGETDWIQLRDLPYVLALDYEVYGADNAVDPSITRTWWEKNPYACRIMFNANDRKEIWGALTILPMKEETILRILKSELAEQEITADDIYRFETGNSYCGYVASTVIRPEHRNEFRHLLQGIIDYWCANYPQIKMTKLYAYAFSDEGMQLIKHLFFSPRYDLDERAYELDLTKPSPSRLVRGYQACTSKT